MSNDPNTGYVLAGVWRDLCHVQVRWIGTNQYGVGMVFILLIQPQSNSLYPDGAIYLDRFFFFLNDDKPEWKQAEMKWE